MKARMMAVMVVAMLVAAGGARYTSLSGQGMDPRPVVVCAPCSGAMFGIPAGTGMVLMQSTGGTNLLYFYSLDRRAPGPIAPPQQTPASSIYSAAPSPSAAASAAMGGSGMESAPILIGRMAGPGSPLIWSVNGR